MGGFVGRVCVGGSWWWVGGWCGGGLRLSERRGREVVCVVWSLLGELWWYGGVMRTGVQFWVILSVVWVGAWGVLENLLEH